MGMDAEVLNSVPCTSHDISVSQGGPGAGKEPCVPWPQWGLLQRFSLQGAGEQRRRFLTETTCGRRGNATGAGLKKVCEQCKRGRNAPACAFSSSAGHRRKGLTCRRAVWSLECIQVVQFPTAAIRAYLGTPRKWQSPLGWAVEGWGWCWWCRVLWVRWSKQD